MQEKKRVLFGNAPPRPREGLRWGRLPVQSSPKPSPASPVSRSPRMRPLLARRRKITVRRPCSAVGPEQKQLTAQGGRRTAHPPPRGTPPPLRKNHLRWSGRLQPAQCRPVQFQPEQDLLEPVLVSEAHRRRLHLGKVVYLYQVEESETSRRPSKLGLK